MTVSPVVISPLFVSSHLLLVEKVMELNIEYRFCNLTVPFNHIVRIPL